MAAAAADAMGQAFQAAAINAQLTALPIFSDNVKEDKLTAKQWLEKMSSTKLEEIGRIFKPSPTSGMHSEAIW